MGAEAHAVRTVPFLGQGSRIGQYELVRRLRSGGMGALFLAHAAGAAGFHREVAIKVIHGHLSSNPEFAQMFVDEARLASLIHHPNVRSVEHLGVHDDAYYMVLEYVPGCSLLELMRKLRQQGRRLAPTFAVHIAARMAEALHAAHELRDGLGRPVELIHRDVCPGNILVAFEGHLKLIDFGIAKALGRKTSTTVGVLKGKPAYMAPEQSRGDRIDRRTDIYALGLVLWEMLTSEQAIRGTRDLDVLRASLLPSIPPVGTRVAVPAELEVVVSRALAPDSRQRYSTAWQFRQALLRALPRARAIDSVHMRALIRSATEERATPRCVVLPEELAPTSAVDDADLSGGRTDTEVEHVEDLSVPDGPSFTRVEEPRSRPLAQCAGPDERVDSASRITLPHASRRDLLVGHSLG